jgi:hypothetical protein
MEQEAKGLIGINYVDGSHQEFEFVFQKGKGNRRQPSMILSLGSGDTDDNIIRNHVVLEKQGKLTVIPFQEIREIEISPFPME